MIERNRVITDTDVSDVSDVTDVTDTKEMEGGNREGKMDEGIRMAIAIAMVAIWAERGR